MAVTQVNLNGQEYTITNEKLSEALDQLDTDANGKVDINDYNPTWVSKEKVSSDLLESLGVDLNDENQNVSYYCVTKPLEGVKRATCSFFIDQVIALDIVTILNEEGIKPRIGDSHTIDTAEDRVELSSSETSLIVSALELNSSYLRSKNSSLSVQTNMLRMQLDQMGLGN